MTLGPDGEANPNGVSPPSAPLPHEPPSARLRFRPPDEPVGGRGSGRRAAPQELWDAPARARRPVMLIAATTRWISTARQALAFAEAGFIVEAVRPHGHPLDKLDFIRGRHLFEATAPAASLRRAIEACQPDLIAPADERAVARLHELYALGAAADDPASRRLCALIQRSMGDPGAFEEARSRGRFMQLAGVAGVRRPETIIVADLDHLVRSLATFGFPAVLKTDGSWGGEGVRIVRNLAEAKRAYRRLTRRPNPAVTLKRLTLDLDVHFAASAVRHRPPVVSLQRYVQGRPASAAAACWRGEVLTLLGAEAIRTSRPRGHASVVRTLDHPEMREAAERMANRLGLSGLYGFDFLLDKNGAAWLVELNARATSTSHLALGEGGDPAQALRARLEGHSATARAPRTADQLIALFPQEMERDPRSEFLFFAAHDLPTRYPPLVRVGHQAAWRARWRRLYRSSVRWFQRADI